MSNNSYILDFKRGDVNGNFIKDNVYLVGKRPYSNSAFSEDIKFIVQDSFTKNYTTIPLQENAGYKPTITLKNFTNKKAKDILISIDSGGSGGYAFYYIFSMLNNNPKEIFNSEKFNQKYKYSVKYKNNYEVELIDLNTSQKYLINIMYKGKEYLSEIYNNNGILKNPIKGWVNPLGGLYPIDFQRDGIYELYATQRIAGRYNADGLGYVQTSLEWKNTDFKPFFQTVGILG